jgi:PHP family Zn ribbon phosphoesterase
VARELHCPRCGWRFETRNASWSIEYCPRCLAHALRAVQLEKGALAVKNVRHASHRPPTTTAA